MIDFITKSLGLEKAVVEEILNNPEKHYTVKYIKKKNDAKRRICIPDHTLDRIQRLILKQYIMKYPVSKHSAAYEKKNSIKKALRPHRGKKHFLKMDIKHFFECISFHHIAKLFDEKLSYGDINILWKLVSYDNGLPIGSATSPFLGNRIMYLIDKEIAKSCKGLDFTRYADDLILSSRKKIAFEYIKIIEVILKENRFEANRDKTLFLGPNQSQKILGLIMNGKNPALGSKYKRNMKSIIYNFLMKKEGNREKIAGLISYIKSVEPDFNKKLSRKYKKIGYNNI